MSAWVYIRSEPGLWTVGFFTPGGDWKTDSDHGSSEDAAKRAAWLNGGSTDGHYTSNSCQHGDCISCTDECEYCDEPCRHQCHALHATTVREDPAGEADLVRIVERLRAL